MCKTIWGGGAAVVGVAMWCLAVVPTGSAAALVDTPWGPSRATFTWANPATYATFNSITDNPTIGDERNFVRVKEAGSHNYVDDITLEAGKVYDMYIYYHNNADGHEVGQSAIGIADGVLLKSNFPATIKAGEKLTANASITAKDTKPLKVWDGVYLRAKENLSLTYVQNSAIIHNGGALNGKSIGPAYLFGKDGALLGYNEFSGMLPGCNKYAGYITYQIQATGGTAPNTTTPQEIPETGPAEVALAAFLIAMILGGAIYYFKTRKKLSVVQRGVMHKNATASKAGKTGKRVASAKKVTRKRS